MLITDANLKKLTYCGKMETAQSIISCGELQKCDGSL